MDVLQNMMLFSELVQCGGNVYTWCYDAQGKLLRSNCPDEKNIYKLQNVYIMLMFLL